MKDFSASMWRWQHGENRSRRIFLNVCFSVPNELAHNTDVIYDAAIKALALRIRNPALWNGHRFQVWSARNDPKLPRGTCTFLYPG